MRHLTLLALAAVSLPLATPAATRADDASGVPGHVIVARTTEDALLIWDASPEVATIVRDKVSDSDANARIEHDALRVLATSLKKVSAAKTITVRVIYNKTGDVSPTYGAPTFAGVERYATVTVDSANAAGDKDKWQELDAKANPPAWIAYKVIGALPPRS